MAYPISKTKVKQRSLGIKIRRLFAENNSLREELPIGNTSHRTDGKGISMREGCFAPKLGQS